MSINAQKITVGLLGFALLGSVIAVGYVDAARSAAQRKRDAYQPTLTPALAKGRAVYEKYSCVVCHGADAKGNLPNFNAQTGQKTPGVDKVGDSYTKKELKEKIRIGVDQVERADPNGPRPPLAMPAFKDVMADAELDQLVDYLFALIPPKEKDEF